MPADCIRDIPGTVILGQRSENNFQDWKSPRVCGVDMEIVDSDFFIYSLLISLLVIIFAKYRGAEGSSFHDYRTPHFYCGAC